MATANVGTTELTGNPSTEGELQRSQSSRYRQSVDGYQTFFSLVNQHLEYYFYHIGYYISLRPWIYLTCIFVVIIACAIGLTQYEAETDTSQLWTPVNAPTWQENKFIDEYWSDLNYELLILAATAKEGYETNILYEEYLNEWLDIHLDWVESWPQKNITKTNDNGDEVTITFGFFYKNYEEPPSLDTILNYSTNNVYVSGYTSKVIPFCRPFASSPLEGQFELPCYMLSLFDCFTEGGFNYPYENYLAKTSFTNSYPSNYYLTKPSFEGLNTSRLGEVLGPSCVLWTGTSIPSNYIYGGETRINESDSSSSLTSVNSFETIFYVDSAYNIAKKIKIALGKCTYTTSYGIKCPEPDDDDLDEADDFMNDWLADLIDWQKDYIKDHKNDDSKLLNVVFFTPRTTSDLLSAAISANIGLLIGAYVAMVVFAAFVALRPYNLFISRCEATTAGAIIIVLTLVGSLGVGAYGIKFSPNIIQALPFIGLSFGFHQMYVLLFSFKYSEKLTVTEMISETTRVGGSSLALTFAIVFFTFVIGATMPLPDVARFAKFGLIMIFLNFWTVLIGFTAILTFVARRMKNGYNDCACICCWNERCKAKEKDKKMFVANNTNAPLKSPQSTTAPITSTELITSQSSLSVTGKRMTIGGQYDELEYEYNDTTVCNNFFNLLTNTTVRIILILMFFGLAAVGIYGTTIIRVGLPFADIFPDGTYAQEFLTVRSKFYFSYVVSLWTDAHGADLTPIDWPNKFETWINQTNEIYSISDLIYTDPGVHDFWAWDLQQYLQNQYSLYFESHSLSTLEISTVVSKSYQCEDDRLTYCSYVMVDYSYNSDLYVCLMFNYDSLSNTGCQAYLTSITETTSTTIARQIYVTAPYDSQASGLYVAPSDDTTNVFYKYDSTTNGADGTNANYGALYQKNDYSWAILNENFKILYENGETTSESYPPQSSWTDTDGNYAALTLIFYDSDLKDENVERPNDIFIDSDITRNSFMFNYKYYTTGDISTSCNAFELFQRSLSETTSFKQIQFSNVNNNITCDAIIESSTICSNIANGIDISLTECGVYEPTTYTSTWWANDCGDYTIAATSNNVNINTDVDVSCGCENSTILDGISSAYSFGYLAPCSSNWGGFGISSTNKQCSNSNQNISITCSALDTCTTLDSCLEDASNLNNCNLTNYFDNNKDSTILMSCLISNYSLVSTCCQEAIQTIYIDTGLASCSELSASTASNLCSIADYCTSACASICYDSINADCADDIQNTICLPYYNDNNSTGLYDCVSTVTTSSCCSASLASDVAYKNCIIPRETYWDYTTSMYDYSDCSSETTSVGCGTYDATQTQLDCMLDEIDNISEGCCKQALTMAQGTNSFTSDCQGDVAKYCNITYAADATDSCLSLLVTESLSTNCNTSLRYCNEEDDWPVTLAGATASSNCSTGYSGTQTRKCLSDSTIPYWDDIDDSQCSIKKCASQTDSYGLYYAESDAYTVLTWLQDRIPSHYIPSGSPCDTTNYLSTTVSYLYAYCSVNETTNEPYWETPVFNCKSSYGTWNSPTETTTCNATTASLIYSQDMSSISTSTSDAVSTCKSLCTITLASSYCVGFTYDNSTQLCNFYDYCDPVTDDSLYPNTNLYISPLALTPTVQYLCAKFRSVSSNSTYNSNGIPSADCFNMTIWQFFKDPQGGVLYIDKMIFNDKDYIYSTTGFISIQIKTTSNSFAIHDLDDDEVAVTFIEDLRSRLDEWRNDYKLYAIPGGQVISLYTQYVGVEHYLLVDLAYCSIIVVVISFIFLLDPVAVLVISIIILTIIVEIYGFIEFAGLRINGVSSLNIVISVGLSMEFTSHINRAYIMADGSTDPTLVGLPSTATSKQVRLKKALKSMFNPLTLSAFTTFIGVLPIVGATFPYFRQYYFILYVLIVAFGWLNGVIFQPVILSFLNPGVFVVKKKQYARSESIRQLSRTQSVSPTGQQTNNSNGNINVDVNSSNGNISTEMTNM